MPERARSRSRALPFPWDPQRRAWRLSADFSRDLPMIPRDPPGIPQGASDPLGDPRDPLEIPRDHPEPRGSSQDCFVMYTLRTETFWSATRPPLGSRAPWGPWGTVTGNLSAQTPRCLLYRTHPSVVEALNKDNHTFSMGAFCPCAL